MTKYKQLIDNIAHEMASENHKKNFNDLQIQLMPKSNYDPNSELTKEIINSLKPYFYPQARITVKYIVTILLEYATIHNHDMTTIEPFLTKHGLIP